MKFLDPALNFVQARRARLVLCGTFRCMLGRCGLFCERTLGYNVSFASLFQNLASIKIFLSLLVTRI